MDGRLRCSATLFPKKDFAKEKFYTVMATHRWENGWDSGESYMKVWGIHIG